MASNFLHVGFSLIFHSHSPRIPTAHLNIRFFEIDSKKYWIGGVCDLTPYSYAPKDFSFFHREMKKSIEKTHPKMYPKFKAACDQYFTLPHRGEMRGIGGVFLTI